MKREHYFIYINGTPVSVTKEQYLAYHQGARRMRYFEQDIKTERPIRNKSGEIIGYSLSKEDSLERLSENGDDLSDEDDSVEGLVTGYLTAKALHTALGKLPPEDFKLIQALFFSNSGKGMTEREYADTSGIAQKTINDRKRKILVHLKKSLRN